MKTKTKMRQDQSKKVRFVIMIMINQQYQNITKCQCHLLSFLKAKTNYSPRMY
jgi:hypothetical protein